MSKRMEKGRARLAKLLVFHATRLEFIVVGSLSLFAKIGLVAIKYGVKHFVILGDVEIVVSKGACEYLLCQWEKLIELRGSAPFKLRTAEMSGRDIENAIGSVGAREFDIDTFDETSQRGFRGTIDSIEGRTQESGDAHHDGTRKICLLLQTLVEVVHDAQRGEGIDLERTHQVGFVDVFEKRQARKTCRDEESIHGRKMGEDAVVFVGEIELLHSKLGMVLLR